MDKEPFEGTESNHMLKYSKVRLAAMLCLS